MLMAGCTEIQTGGEDPIPVDKPNAGSEKEPETPDAPPAEPEITEFPEDAPPLEFISYFRKSNADIEAHKNLNKVSLDINKAIASNAGKVIPQYNGNYSFSPVSATMCLGLIANSLDSPKNEEIAKLLGSDNIDELSNLITRLLQYLPSPTNEVDLKLTNSIWYSDFYTISDDFRKKMAYNFATSIYRRNFYSASTIDEINAWASRNTNGMINSVIDEIPAFCNLMWYNALFFQGNWDNKFDVKQTKNENFFGSLKTSNIPMMRQENLMPYSKTQELHMTSIPFGGYSYMFDIIMPINPANKDFWKNLDYETYQQLLGAGHMVIVNIIMPRLSVNNRIALSDILIDMGFPVHELTFNSTGITGMFPIESIGIGQSCAFEVDEEGAKAAAVTGGLATSDGKEHPEPERVEMRVDRPFVYLIRERTTGAIVMMGHISNL